MITLTTEQAQQIEEAMESVHGLSGINMSKPLATIRAARAQEQAEQEPVGYFAYDEEHDIWEELTGPNAPGATPLYAAPVRTRFAALVAAHEAEKWKVANKRDYENWKMAAEKAAECEREACAKVCDKYAEESSNPMNFAENCAAAIRARGEK